MSQYVDPCPSRRSILRAAIAIATTILATSGLLALDLEFQDPLRLTDEMRSWIDRKVFAGLPDSVKARDLLNAINGLDLDYRVGQTGTATDIFETGRFNCVSFSFLFVSLSRHVGLDTHFLRAIDDPSYTKEGELVIVSEHMSAGLREGVRSRVLDYQFLPDPALHRFRRLSDQEAIALYYSNLGAEHLLDGKPEMAMAFFEKAAETDPGLSEIWVNLGVARRRAGDHAGAESAYLRALETDPDDTRAYLNLVSLMWRLGRADASKQLLSLLERGDPRDPYAYLVLGDHARRGRRLEDAEKLYRRAIIRDRSSAEARAALGLLLFEMGEMKKAAKRLRQAQKRDREDPRALELARMLEQTND